MSEKSIISIEIKFITKINNSRLTLLTAVHQHITMTNVTKKREDAVNRMICWQTATEGYIPMSLSIHFILSSWSSDATLMMSLPIVDAITTLTANHIISKAEAFVLSWKIPVLIGVKKRFHNLSDFFASYCCISNTLVATDITSRKPVSLNCYR